MNCSWPIRQPTTMGTTAQRCRWLSLAGAARTSCIHVLEAYNAKKDDVRSGKAEKGEVFKNQISLPSSGLSMTMPKNSTRPSVSDPGWSSSPSIPATVAFVLCGMTWRCSRCSQSTMANGRTSASSQAASDPITFCQMWQQTLAVVALLEACHRRSQRMMSLGQCCWFSVRLKRPSSSESCSWVL